MYIYVPPLGDEYNGLFSLKELLGFATPHSRS